MRSSTVRILDVPPYNTFTGSCSVSVEVPGLEGHVQQPRGTWLWERKKGSDNEVQVMDSSTVSKVVMNEVSEGQVLYRCTYNLGGRDNINSIDKMTNSVIGKYTQVAYTSISILSIQVLHTPIHLSRYTVTL